MMNKINIKQTSLLFLMLFLIKTAHAVDIKTSVDRNPVNINESFQLTFTANESPDEEPDFKPLNKNFEILNNRKSSNSSWVNGQSTKSIQWVLNVMAKKAGDVVIPAISFGDDSSESVVLSVSKGKISEQDSQKSELFLKVEATPTKVYVQSQVLYTLKFYHSVQLANRPRLEEPEVPEALVEKLEGDKNYMTEINGVTYKVTELKYAIFPQKSGQLIINPFVITTEVVSKSAPRFNGFFSQQMTKTKRVMSKAITLNVLPAPSKFKGKHWIPAEQVYIEESWSGDVNNMKVGEPLTRTLSLLAKGTTVAQLPELQSEIDIPQLKSYPDQPVLKEKKQADGLIALREEKIAYIPSKAGSFTLPAIKIEWFNTQTKKMQVATIPAKKITALALEGQVESTPVFADSKLAVKKSEIVQTIQTVESPFWMWIAIFFASAWLITLFFLVKKRKKVIAKIIENPTELKIKEVIKTLKKACQEDDKNAAKEALLAWGKIKYKQNSLSSIANQCSVELKEEIEALNQNLYASQAEAWQGENLLKVFTAESKIKDNSAMSSDELEPLYKA